MSWINNLMSGIIHRSCDIRSLASQRSDDRTVSAGSNSARGIARFIRVNDSRNESSVKSETFMRDKCSVDRRANNEELCVRMSRRILAFDWLKKWLAVFMEPFYGTILSGNGTNNYCLKIYIGALDDTSYAILLISSKLRAQNWFHSRSEHIMLRTDEILTKMSEMFDQRKDSLAPTIRVTELAIYGNLLWVLWENYSGEPNSSSRWQDDSLFDRRNFRCALKKINGGCDSKHSNDLVNDLMAFENISLDLPKTMEYGKFKKN